MGRRFFALFAGLFTLSAPLSVMAELTNLSPEDVERLLAQGTVLVDVRTQREWQQTGVVEGSHLLTFFDDRGRYDANEWLRNLDKIVKKDQPLILICRSGNRTGQIGNFLDKRLGFQQVYHLQGGIQHWMRSGKKTIKP